MGNVYIFIGGRRNAGRIAAFEQRATDIRRKLGALRLMDAAGVITPDIYSRYGLGGVRIEIEYYEGELRAIEDYLQRLKG